jgi:hypothetical protein
MKLKEMDKYYSWKTAKCIRYGEDFTGENHPCYWCGEPPKDMLGPDIIWCEKCGGFRCPSCGKCWCNVPAGNLEALKFLRNKYCCNWPNFKRGMVAVDRPLLRFVSGFEKALDYCRTRKGFTKKVNPGSAVDILRGRPFTIRL